MDESLIITGVSTNEIKEFHRSKSFHHRKKSSTDLSITNNSIPNAIYKPINSDEDTSSSAEMIDVQAKPIKTGEDIGTTAITSSTKLVPVTSRPITQDESLLPPGDIKVSTVLSSHIDMIIDEVIKEINWCSDEFEKSKEENYIQASLSIIEHVDPWMSYTSQKPKYKRVDLLSMEEKNELMHHLTNLTEYLLNLFPDPNIITTE